MLEERSKIVNESNVKPFRTPQQKRQRWIAVIVVILVLALTGVAYLLLVPREDTYKLKSFTTSVVMVGDLAQTTQASGSVEIPVQIQVASPQAGEADALFVGEGESVVKGQALARLDVPDMLEELDDLVSSFDSAEKSLEKSAQQDLIMNKRAEREIQNLKKQIAEAEEERDRLAELVRINASRRSDLETAEKQVEELRDNRVEKELQLEEDKALQALDVEINRANIAGIETKIARLKAEIEEATIRSPMTGQILEIDGTIGVPGSAIKAGQVLFVIVDPGSAIIELDVDEQYASAISEGRTVTLTINNVKSIGTVASVGQVAQMSSDGLGATITVKVKPSAESGTLLQGTTVVGEFELGVKEGALLLPRGPYLTTGSQRYLYVVNGNTAERREVTFGKIQGNNVEVLKGVEAGDEVITSGYQNFIEYKNIQLLKGE
ncbi:MAG: HlyD family efflux transporter periplasmic adaptor subunit [Spirochaetales bacterium]|nr:HlyD family efflux transporter periplasmic adaptor subunit [Spirochaetales bacterium]